MRFLEARGWYAWESPPQYPRPAITINAYRVEPDGAQTFCADAVVVPIAGGKWKADIRSIADVGSPRETMVCDTQAEAKAWAEAVLRMM